MKHESFRHPFIAKMINRYFVPILIDRHQQPLVDDMYSRLLEYQKSTFGWPATIMATPDGIPLFLSTYVNRRKLKRVLTIIYKDWAMQSEISQQKAYEWLDQYAESKKIKKDVSIKDPLLNIEQFLINSFDHQFAGIGESKKFPMFFNWSFALMLSSDFSKYAQRSVNAIILSPMFDFIEGGVHRYSQTRDWRDPHFEKIFNDQLYFIQLLAQLYAITRNPFYLDLATFNATFVLKNFRQDNGTFITGLDAGELGFPGAYYFFDDDFLDQISPLAFERVPYKQFRNLSSLVNTNNFYVINREPLINKRKNSSSELKKDVYVSIQDNARFLITLLFLNEVAESSPYDDVIDQLLTAILLHKPNTLSTFDLLVVYDALSSLSLSINLTPYEDQIKAQISMVFPFYKPLPYVPLKLQVNDYFDSYSSPQPLYYLLKYRQRLLPNYSEAQMCADLKQVIHSPWYQLSLVKIYNTSCR